MRLTVVFLFMWHVCLSQTYTAEVEKAADFFQTLPPSSKIRSPEFDTRTTYLCKYDPVANCLVIRLVCKDTLGIAFHFDQGIYEIPLDELNAESILIEDEKVDDHTMLVRLRFLHPMNSPKFSQYWMRDDKIAFIQTRDDFDLGPWKKSDEIIATLNKLKSQITAAAKLSPTANKQLANKKPNKYTDITLRMKVRENIVTTTIPKDTDPKLPSGYYMFQSLETKPKMLGTTDDVESLRVLKKLLKDYSRKNKIDLQPATWFMISIDETGATDLVQIIPRDQTENSLSISGIEAELKWVPGKFNGVGVKSKYFVVLD